MSRKDKKLPALPKGRKDVPQSAQQEHDGFALPIGWNFSQMETSSKTRWKCTFKRLTRHRGRLLALEGKSFQQIDVEQQHSHNWEDTSKLHPEFQQLLTNKKIESGALWQLDLGGKARLFGIRDRNIFKVVWLDEDHTIYKTSKKDT